LLVFELIFSVLRYKPLAFSSELRYFLLKMEDNLSKDAISEEEQSSELVSSLSDQQDAMGAAQSALNTDEEGRPPISSEMHTFWFPTLQAFLQELRNLRSERSAANSRNISLEKQLITAKSELAEANRLVYLFHKFYFACPAIAISDCGRPKTQRGGHCTS
jgi:hypothetical protein